MPQPAGDCIQWLRLLQKRRILRCHEFQPSIHLLPRRISYIGGHIDPVFERRIEAATDLSLTRIDKTRPFADVRETLATCHAIQIDSARSDIPGHLLVERSLLSHCPKLLIVSASGAGYDTVDVAACTEAGIIAVNQSGGNRESVAEHTLGMMLSLIKRIAETDKLMRESRIERRMDFMGNELHGRTIGIIGIGQTGSRVAELCRGLFAMTVLAFDPYVDAEAMAAYGARKTSLSELLGASDFVSLHCPLDATTKGMIGAGELAQMKPGAYLVRRRAAASTTSTPCSRPCRRAGWQAPGSMSGRKSHRRPTIRCWR